ncbi:hypothetical protein BKA83DRAFT_4188538, partial [Pisolithus microcarpus]
MGAIAILARSHLSLFAATFATTSASHLSTSRDCAVAEPATADSVMAPARRIAPSSIAMLPRYNQEQIPHQLHYAHKQTRRANPPVSFSFPKFHVQC